MKHWRMLLSRCMTKIKGGIKMSDLVVKEQEIMDSLGDYSQLIERINISELPTIIEEQVKKIEELGEKIETALSTAEEAKSVAEKTQEMEVKWGQRKKVIRELQKSGTKSAEAIGETVGALKVSFEHEKQLAEISKFLLAIAACSAAHTEQAIEEINNAIQNRAAGKPLNNTAKERLQEIVNQMKAQGETIKRMEEKEAQDEEQNKQIREMAEDDDRQDALIGELQNKIQSLEKWKIATFVISALALALTLLQIFGII